MVVTRVLQWNQSDKVTATFYADDNFITICVQDDFKDDIHFYQFDTSPQYNLVDHSDREPLDISLTSKESKFKFKYGVLEFVF